MPDRILGWLVGVGLVGGGTGLALLAILVLMGSVAAIVAALVLAIIATR